MVVCQTCQEQCNCNSKAQRLQLADVYKGEATGSSFTSIKLSEDLGLIRLLNYIVNDIPKHAQKALLPGIWLTEVSVDSYKVPEFPENVKVTWAQMEYQLPRLTKICCTCKMEIGLLVLQHCLWVRIEHNLV